MSCPEPTTTENESTFVILAPTDPLPTPALKRHRESGMEFSSNPTSPPVPTTEISSSLVTHFPPLQQSVATTPSVASPHHTSPPDLTLGTMNPRTPFEASSSVTRTHSPNPFTPVANTPSRKRRAPPIFPAASGKISSVPGNSPATLNPPAASPSSVQTPPSTGPPAPTPPHTPPVPPPTHPMTPATTPLLTPTPRHLLETRPHQALPDEATSPSLHLSTALVPVSSNLTPPSRFKRPRPRTGTSSSTASPIVWNRG